MPSEEIVVITGAAGRIGRAIVPLLAAPGRRLRLLDVVEPPVSLRERGEWGAVTLADRPGLRAAFTGAHAVIHLAGHPAERSWADILAVNIDGTQAVLEAAEAARVPRVLLASSIHAVGYSEPGEVGAVEVLSPRPDTYYGVGKAATEALGSVFADRYGMTIVSARICTFGDEPGEGRSIAQWLSPGDAARLVEAVIALDEPGHHIVWGVSRNEPDWFPLGPGERIGYHPRDDARRRSRERHGVDPPAPDERGPLGASFADAAHPLGTAWA